MTELHPTRRTVVKTAAWTVPAVTLATAAPAFAASSNFTDLSTTAAVSPVRSAPDAVQMPTTMAFTNTGDVDIDGATVQITSTIAVTSVTVNLGAPVDVGSVGITFNPPLPATNFTMTVPAGGLLAIPAGGSAGLPLPLDLGLAASGSVDMSMTVTGTNAVGATNIPFISPTFTID